MGRGAAQEHSEITPKVADPPTNGASTIPSQVQGSANAEPMKVSSANVSPDISGKQSKFQEQAQSNGKPASPPSEPLPPPPPPPNDSEAAEAAAKRRKRAGMLPLTDVQRVQRKWQMASVVHFLDAFRNVLPLKEISADTAEDLTPSLLEEAVAEPEINAAASLMLRDVVKALLIVIDEKLKENIEEKWYESLKQLVRIRRGEFLDCFDGDLNVMDMHETGMDFLTAVGWNVRLGLLLSLCDVAAETGAKVREKIRETELASSIAKSELDIRGFRLKPIGRCSKKRFHFKIGESRIYSGYKRKGSGALVVECSDSKTMSEYSNALHGEGEPKDRVLADRIRETFLPPLLDREDKARKKVERKRMQEIQREESRRRNAKRPRRSKAAYI